MPVTHVEGNAFDVVQLAEDVAQSDCVGHPFNQAADLVECYDRVRANVLAFMKTNSQSLSGIKTSSSLLTQASFS